VVVQGRAGGIGNCIELTAPRRKLIRATKHSPVRRHAIQACTLRAICPLNHQTAIDSQVAHEVGHQELRRARLVSGIHVRTAARHNANLLAALKQIRDPQVGVPGAVRRGELGNAGAGDNDLGELKGVERGQGVFVSVGFGQHDGECQVHHKDDEQG